MKTTKEEKQKARESLTAWLKPTNTVFTILRHVSRSGMMRHISLLTFKNNQPILLDYNVSMLMEYPMAKKEGLKVSGCGMDMGFHLVYELSYALFKDGYKLNHRWL